LEVDVTMGRGFNAWYRPASSRADKSDGVSVNLPTTHVRVTLDSDVQTTITVAENDKPKYNGHFSFVVTQSQLTSGASELVFDVLEDEKKAAQPLVGSLSVPLHTVSLLKSCPEDWYAVIDARTGLTFGELRIKWALVTPRPGEVSTSTRTAKRFCEWFGFTDFYDSSEFPRVDDYEPPTGKVRHKTTKQPPGPRRPIKFYTGGFDLDLSYIVKDRIIAMAVPGAGNNIGQCADFFKKFHAGNYKSVACHPHPPTHIRLSSCGTLLLQGPPSSPTDRSAARCCLARVCQPNRQFNLCAESKYAVDKFDAGTVVEFPFEEAGPPAFAQLLTVVQEIDRHLSASPTRVVAVQCRTGRGRTGIVVCAYLLYSRLAGSADDALQLFAAKRTQNVAGLRNPSSIRYIRYFEKFLRDHLWPARPFSANAVVTLQHVRFSTVPAALSTGGCDPYFVAFGPYPHKPLFYDHLKACNGKVAQFRSKDLTHCDIPCAERKVQLHGDVRFVFYNLDSAGGGASDRLFAFTINTSFIGASYVVLHKHELEGAKQDTAHKIFDPNFKIELFFKMESTL
jgi:hypothetical protein